MHYDLYPVEWSAELRIKEAHRRAEHGRLVSFFKRLRRQEQQAQPKPESQPTWIVRPAKEPSTQRLQAPSAGD